MLWVKAFHLVFMVTWFAAVFYLPRLFVYHAMAKDETSIERFKIMERKLLHGIMNPGALLTLLSGSWLWLGYGISGGWLYAKLVVVALLVVYHLWCIVIVKRFARDENTHSHVYYRWMNEVPVLFLVSIIVLVVVKPI
jgi:putative membrane protein